MPALASFQQILGVYTTKFGWGLGEAIHAPNERLSEAMYTKVRSSPWLGVRHAPRTRHAQGLLLGPWVEVSARWFMKVFDGPSSHQCR
jgi:hypothetical protein